MRTRRGGWLSDVDGMRRRRRGGEAGDVVLMLVGDEDGRESGGILVGVFMRLSSSRQERPASTSRLVSAEAMTVELPLEPEARTVMRMRLRYAGSVWIGG